MKEIEQFLRATYPNASHVMIDVDNHGMALRVEYAKPMLMKGVWGLDGVEQFPPSKAEPSAPTSSGESSG